MTERTKNKHRGEREDYGNLLCVRIMMRIREAERQRKVKLLGVREEGMGKEQNMSQFNMSQF